MNSPIPSTDAWQRLLARRTRSREGPAIETAPPGFAPRVVTRWLRDPRHSGMPGTWDLWEIFAARVALGSAVVALALLLMNFTSLRQVGAHLDAVAIDPLSLLLGAIF